MGFARAKFRISGEKASLEGVAVVDTNSLMTVVDKKLVDELGLVPTTRILRLTTLSGEEVLCDEMLSKELMLEDEKLASERVATCELPSNVKEKLKAMNADPCIIIGVVTLEAAGLIVNPLTGKLQKVGWLAL